LAWITGFASGLFSNLINSRAACWFGDDAGTPGLGRGGGSITAMRSGTAARARSPSCWSAFTAAARTSGDGSLAMMRASGRAAAPASRWRRCQVTPAAQQVSRVANHRVRTCCACVSQELKPVSLPLDFATAPKTRSTVSQPDTVVRWHREWLRRVSLRDRRRHGRRAMRARSPCLARTAPPH